MKMTVKQKVKKLSCALLAALLILQGINIPGFKKAAFARAASSIVESAISWAVSVANNNSHGYSQSNRWGPNYDCSSFVISAFKNAGVNVGSATYTGNMRAEFTKHGFQWIPWSQIGGVAKLKRGDILLNEVQHTEIYLGNNQNVGAHSNRGYPQTGDQTGTEISVSGYYYHPWNGVLRYAGKNVCSCSASYAGDYYVSTNSLPLTMRSGHGTGYSVVTTIPKGSKVYVSRGDGNWAHTEWNGYKGYCSMGYLKRYTSKSYNLHVWVSDTEMGGVPSDFVKGKRYYICYELIDESTGKKANETGNINYTATETVRNADGKVYEYSYKNSDYNWISVVCGKEDTYTGTVTISGDIKLSCGVSFNVYADVSPQIKVWTWDKNDTKGISTVDVGKNVYCSYLISDKNTGKNLNAVSPRCTQGQGYTVTIMVYDPKGSLVKKQSYKNKDNIKFSFIPNKTGEYRIKTSITGNLTGSRQNTITVKPTVKPTARPTVKSTAKPTVRPTARPTVKPTVTPTARPTVKPTARPTATPTVKPTVTPTARPIVTTTVKPTIEPAIKPTIMPTEKPVVESGKAPKKKLDGIVVKISKNGVSYKVYVKSKTAVFYKANKRAKRIVIPDTIMIDGVKYKVTAISNNAFNGCKKLKYLTIGKNISAIGKKAFFKCKSLKKIRIPYRVIKKWKKVFYGGKKVAK